MSLQNIKDKLSAKSIFLSEEKIADYPTIIGYEKKFKWSWFATQLNTFVIASDLGDKLVTKEIIETHLSESFKYAKKNYKGWPRGLQSGVGVISILISKNIDEEAIEYCKKMKSGKKWAGFTIPVAINPSTNETYYFDKNPIWGRLYYPHFKKLITELT